LLDAWTRERHHAGRLPEEALKSFLLKVAVLREDLGETMAAHHVHGDTVCEAVVLIGTLFIE
jgi:hypothetical protein